MIYERISTKMQSMETDFISSTASAITTAQNALFELSKANIERVDMWFGRMIDISALIFTAITLILGVVAFLTWRHIDQANKAQKLLDETEKKLAASDQFLSNLARREAIGRRLAKITKQGLLRSEVAERALHHRGFAPALYKTLDDNKVFAVDEYGFKHWIPNPPTLTRMGYSWTDVKQITKEELDKIPTGENIPDLSQ